MNWFLNRQLGTKLLLSFSVLLSLTVALGTFSIVQLAKVNETAAEVGERLMPIVRSVSDLSTRMANFRLAEQQHILASGPSEKRKIDKTLADAAAGFDKSQKEYLGLVTSTKERELSDSFNEKWKVYMAEHKKVLELSTNGFTEQAKDLSTQKSQEQFEAARAVLGQLVDLSAQRVQDSSQRGAQTYASSRSLIVGALACSVLIGLGLAVTLTRVVSKPLRRAVQIAQTVASGDLSSHIEVTSNDETGKLLAALRDMNNSLGTVVGSVREGAAGVANSSARIATSSVELNRRSELQASNLQQTAASMEQLTGTVRNNTEAARQATDLAQSASAVAEEGGKVVRSVVGTMADISASSRRIADIIGVIDGIAFQTNILALNAAVEAARAGEQGRGFSVVASEVRNLAQRSAVSAKEIKDLIKVSAQQVEAGSALVGNAGDTMDKIVSQVNRVTELIAAMNSSTAEQGAGIGQVNETVAELDRATQQTLQVVQKSSVVADALQVQASHLVEAVSAFKLVAGPSHETGEAIEYA